MKTLVGAFNKEKALVEAFSGHCETSRSTVGSSSVVAVVTCLVVLCSDCSGRTAPRQAGLSPSHPSPEHVCILTWAKKGNKLALL